MGTGKLTFVVGVRWFDSSGEACGGMPLEQPEDQPDKVYSVIDDAWVEEEAIYNQNHSKIAKSAPFCLFQHRHYR